MIISAFNLTYCAVAALFTAFAVAFSLIFRNKPQKTKRIAVAVLYIAALIIFFVYKIGISRDTEYHALISGGQFTFLNELPLNLCNIILWLMPIAMLTMSRPMLAFCFYCTFIGPLAAILMPGIGFDGYNIFLPRMLGYYTTHYIGLMAGPLLVTLGLYKPKMKDILPACILLVVLSFIAFLINWVMRYTGANPYANYFYTIDPEGNVILEFFHNIIPVPYLFSLLILSIIVPLFIIIELLFAAGYKIAGKGKTKA